PRKLRLWAAGSLMSQQQLSAPARLRLRLRKSACGPRSRVLRDIRLRADRATGPDGAARPARRRAAAVRLWRGDAAPAAPLGRRPRRAARGLRLALPRRPLPRAPRDAEDVRA